MKNILVCMKAVPATTQVATDEEFRLKRDSTGLQWNVADEAALEAALRLKGSSGTVTVLTMGPKKLAESLRELLGRGADRALLLTDPRMAGADTHATARALAATVRELGGFDLILCGRRAMDGETGQIPGELASALGLPCVTDVESLQEAEGQLLLRRRLETGIATLRMRLPGVVSICEYAYPLRLPGILALRRARQKQVDILTAADIHLCPEECGVKGSLTKVIYADTRFPGRRKGPKETNITAGVNKLLQLCREVGS